MLGEKPLFARGSEPVILELALAALGRLPLCAEPAFVFETMKRRVKRAMLDLQNVVCGALDVLGDFVSVCAAEQQRAQDEHVQGRSEEHTSELQSPVHL